MARIEEPSAGSVSSESGNASTQGRSALDRYIHEQNLALYRKVLSETTDPAKRQILLKLLSDEMTVRPTQPTPSRDGA